MQRGRRCDGARGSFGACSQRTDFHGGEFGGVAGVLPYTIILLPDSVGGTGAMSSVAEIGNGDIIEVLDVLFQRHGRVMQSGLIPVELLE